MSPPQWGHGPEAVETFGYKRPWWEVEGPQWGHGPEAVETRLTHEGVRQADARRNGATALRPWRLGRHGQHHAQRVPPQWGHGPEAVETQVEVRAGGGEVVPQWGHGPEAVETPPSLRAGSRNAGCRNGATALRPWRRDGHVLTVARGTWPQWGHGPEAVETRLVCPR